MFELRKLTDDWADEDNAAQSHNKKIKHGLDLDFDVLDRFRGCFDIPDGNVYWDDIAKKMGLYPKDDAPSFKDIVCFLCQAPPPHIRLVVCGVTRVRCVLKGAVHASSLGFAETIVVDDLVRPSASDRPAPWLLRVRAPRPN